MVYVSMVCMWHMMFIDVYRGYDYTFFFINQLTKGYRIL
jgi:hypothetical protein